MSEGINLLNPEKKNVRTKAFLRLEGLRLFAGSLLFLVSTASVILFILVAISPLPKLQQQQHSLELTLAESKKDIAKLAYVNERSASIKTILTRRQSLETTLGLIESKLPSGARVTALRADKNIITVIVTSKSLQSLDEFLNGVTAFVASKTAFSQVTMTELTSDETDNVYAMTLSLVLIKQGGN